MSSMDTEPFVLFGNRLDNNFALLEIFIVSEPVFPLEEGDESVGEGEIFCFENITGCAYPVDIIPLTIVRPPSLG